VLTVSLAEPGPVAAQVAAEHRGIRQVLVGPDDRSVRARDLGHRAEHRPTAGALREQPAEGTRGDRGGEMTTHVVLAFQLLGYLLVPLTLTLTVTWGP